MKVLAVSGGVDSVVMLDMLASDAAVVAHFNHGIRPDSDEDEALVGNLAKKYGLKYEHVKEDLGSGASEELARERRYKFLREVAARHGGKICTAHHADDVVESIAINLIRGTGWRGLVPLDSPDIERPLLGMFKVDIREYAEEHGLEWREDSTNSSMDYLRNRVRHALQRMALQDKQDILRLYREQKTLKQQVDALVQEMLSVDDIYERAWFTDLDEAVALEFLRAALEKVGRSATRPQLKGFLQAIRTYETGKKFNLPGDFLVKMGKTRFRLGEDGSNQR
ncbi:MAG: tRNA lysidine(34) synthetase TilS [Candidatus Nomurabacteria bacterium]|jgi:tRNA(Ile)-lysidine synthase|nr:tRNA lysidine(34) synthetase TilS [Candidatus Nomurabacteria bacterium]